MRELAVTLLVALFSLVPASAAIAGIEEARQRREERQAQRWEEYKTRERRRDVDLQAFQLPQSWLHPEPEVHQPVQTERVQGGDFWWHLADCESGVGETSQNMFQFMGGTESKVGYHAGASYEEQKAMAQNWASRIKNPGSTEGWPNCWWEAKSKTGGP